MTYIPLYFIFLLGFTINDDEAVFQFYMVRTNFPNQGKFGHLRKYHRTCGFIIINKKIDDYLVRRERPRER